MNLGDEVLINILGISNLQKIIEKEDACFHSWMMATLILMTLQRGGNRFIVIGHDESQVIAHAEGDFFIFTIPIGFASKISR